MFGRIEFRKDRKTTIADSYYPRYSRRLYLNISLSRAPKHTHTNLLSRRSKALLSSTSVQSQTSLLFVFVFQTTILSFLASVSCRWSFHDRAKAGFLRCTLPLKLIRCPSKAGFLVSDASCCPLAINGFSVRFVGAFLSTLSEFSLVVCFRNRLTFLGHLFRIFRFYIRLVWPSLFKSNFLCKKPFWW